MQYRAATHDDIDLLVSQRMHFIDVDKSSKNYSQIKENCYSYFRQALVRETCDVILAENNGSCIGTGIVFYYDSVPSAFNITGKNAYITSMYVDPEYRRKGIGTEIVSRMIAKARERGYPIIMLNASDMGKPLYYKLGFSEINNGMILDTRKTF